MPSTKNLYMTLDEIFMEYEDRLDCERVKATPRKTRWRNLYYFHVDWIRRRDGKIIPAGKYLSEKIWPSKEIAEQKAADLIEREMKMEDSAWSSGDADYLGAVEDDE